MPDFNNLVKDLYTTNKKELTPEKFDYITKTYSGNEIGFVKDFYTTNNLKLDSTKLDYIQKEYLAKPKDSIPTVQLSKEELEAPQNDYIQSTHDPMLGVDIPTISPKVTKPQKAEKSFWDIVIGGIESLVQDSPQETRKQLPDEFGVKYYEEQKIYPKIGAETDLKKVNEKVELAKKERKLIQDEVIGPQESGPGLDATEAVKGALRISNISTPERDPLMGVDIPRSTPGKLIEKENPDLFNTKVSEELKNLGFDYIEDDNGNLVLAPVNKPTYTPKEITGKLTNITKDWKAESAKLEKEIHDLEESKTPIVTYSAVGTPMYSSKPDLTGIESVKNQKIKELEALNKNYQDTVGLYGNIANTQKTIGASDEISAPGKMLNSLPADTKVDWKAMIPTLQGSKDYIDSLNKDPNLLKNMTTLGIEYSNVANDYDVIKAKERLKNPGTGDKALPQAMMDSWTLSGITNNYRSLQPSIEYDEKVVSQLTSSRDKFIKDAEKKGIATSIIEDELNKSGLSDVITSWTDLLNSKKALATKIAEPSRTSLKDLVAFRASQDYYDKLYKDSPIKTALAAGIGSGMQSLSDLVGLKVFSDHPLNLREDLFRNEYYTPRYDKVIKEAHDKYVESFFDDGKVKVHVPAETEKVPFTSKEGNFLVQSVKNIGKVLGGYKGETEPINWDVLAYQFTKTPIDLIPLVLGGELVAPLKVALGSVIAPLELGATAEAVAGGIEVAGSVGYKYRGAYAAAKLAEATIPKTIGVVIPSMLTFSPENIKMELQNKSLTEDQAVKLGTLRAMVEGIAFSINPIAMANYSKRLLIGESKNILEEKAYKTLIEQSLGTKLSDKVYRFMMDASFIPKAYGETAVNLTTQMNAALAGNAALTDAYQRLANPNYQSPEHEFTAANILTTTTNALATAIPFSAMHLMPKYAETRYARESAMYRIAQAPDWHYNHINEQLKEKLITPEEAVKQKNIIDQLRNIKAKISFDINDIEKDPKLSNIEKHEKSFELFRNAVKQEGLKEELTKDISDEEKSKHLEELDKTALQYQKLVQYREEFENLSPDEKLKEEARIQSRKYIDANFNKDIVTKYQLTDIEARRDELIKLASEETNPYLAVKYADMANAMDIKLGDERFKETGNTSTLEPHVSELIDWVDDKVIRANEEFDEQHRHSTLELDDVDRSEFVKQFVEGQMNSSQKFLYDKYKDLISSEINKRSGVEPESPYEAPKEIKGPEPEIEEFVEHEVIPSQEFTKIEIPEVKESETAVEIPISSINKDAAEIGGWLVPMTINQAIENIKSGNPSVTEGPPTVYVDSNGQYTILDGFHRIAQAIINGDPNLKVEVVQAPVIVQEVPISTLEGRKAEQTLEYRALQETNATVIADNNRSARRVYKLADVDLNEEDGILYSGKKLVRAAGMLAYVGREAKQDPNTQKWTADSDILNQPYARLHSSKFYQAGTPVKYKLVDATDSEFVKEAVKKFSENLELFETYGVITKDEHESLSKDMDNFLEVQVLNDKGEILGYVHDLSYIRSDRIVDYIFKSGGEAVLNIGDALRELINLRKELIPALRDKKELTGNIEGTSIGSRAIRADEKFVPLLDSFKDKTVLKNVTVVTFPDRYRVNNKFLLENADEITPGSAIAAVKTPNNKYHGIVLRRNYLGKEWSSGIVSAISLYTDYLVAVNKNDIAKQEKLKNLAFELSEKLGDPYKYDITTASGLFSYLNNIVFVSSKASTYTSPATRKEYKDIPFFHFDNRDNSIIYSSSRIESKLDEMGDAHFSTIQQLNDAGIFKQVLIDKNGNSNIGKGLNSLMRWLESRPLNFKVENFATNAKFELPLLQKEGDNYTYMSPKIAINTGTSFHDYMLKNLTTDNLELEITNDDGSKENSYFQQPNKSFKVNFPEPKPEIVSDRLEVEDFWDDFKSIKDYNKAKKLADTEGIKYPSIKTSIDDRLKKLRPNMTYEDRLVEHENKWSKHNSLTYKIKQFNGLGRKDKKQLEGPLSREINQVALDLGYKVERVKKGKSTKMLITSKGIPITYKSFPGKPLEVINGKIEWRGLKVGVEDLKGFESSLYLSNDIEHPDFEMSKDLLKTAFKNIQNGKLDKLGAQAVLKKIAEWKSSGSISMVKGSGKFSEHWSESFDDYMELNLQEEYKNLPEPETLTEEEYQRHLNNFEDWFKNLSPKEQEQYYEDYGETEGEEGDFIEPESEIYDEEGVEGETEEGEEVINIKNTLKKELSIEIFNAITVVQDVPLDIIGRNDLYLSMKDVLGEKGITDPYLINWLGINLPSNLSRKSTINGITSEAQIEKMATDSYNKLLKLDSPVLKNKDIKQSFDNWVKALEQYPIAFRDLMLKHAIKNLNPERKSKFVLQLSSVALQQTYGISVNKPNELNRIGKLYDSEVLKTVSDAVGHEPSASGKGYWVHIPRTSFSTSSNIDREIQRLQNQSPEEEGDVSDRIKELREEKEKIKEDSTQHKINVELLRKLSPSTWCTAGGMASHYVENYDNYLLIVNGITVAGIEAYPTSENQQAIENQEEKLKELEKLGAYKVHETYRIKGITNHVKKITNYLGFIENFTGKTRQELNDNFTKRAEELEINYELEVRKVKNTIESLKSEKPLIKVKEVTSRGNNGVASVDHLDDTIAFFEKHNLNLNNETIKNAIAARNKGKTDNEIFNDRQYDGFYEPLEYEPNHEEYYDPYDYDPSDEIARQHEEYLDKERAKAELNNLTTIEEVLAFIEVEYLLDNEFFEAIKPELKDNEQILNRLIEKSPHSISFVSHELPFYLELAHKAVQQSPYVFEYISEEAKLEQRNIDLHTTYLEQVRNRAVEVEDDLPFSKTKENLIQGYYDAKNDKVVVVASNTPVNEAAKVAIHEVAHRGMLRMAKDLGGVDELHDALVSAESQLMKKLPELLKRTGHKDLESLMKDYGFTTKSKEGKTKLLMELAARWAETFTDKPKTSWWKKLLKSLSDWIKKFTGKVLSEKEVNDLVGGFVEYGTKEPSVKLESKEYSDYKYELFNDDYTPSTSKEVKISKIETNKNLENRYKSLTLEEKSRVGSLEEVLSGREDWPDEMIIEWINCNK